MSCPPLEELLQWLRGSLDPAAKSAIEVHLSAGCGNCEKNRQWLSGLLDVTAKDDSFEFSEETIQWSVAQFKVLSGMTKERRSLLSRLIFDSFRPALAADVRAAAPLLSGRQLLFEAEDYEVDLRVEPQDESTTFLVVGQIVNTRSSVDVARVSVELVAAQEKKKTETDARGMFRFRGVAVGDYDLIINLSEGDLLIHGIPCRTE
jgi:hypothetical protein